MGINIRSDDNPTLVAGRGKGIEKSDDIVYLGSRMFGEGLRSVERKVCHQMKLVWKSDMRRDLKVRLFLATVDSILLYGSET